MDHMLELARHQDLLEALELSTVSDGSPADTDNELAQKARALAEKKFLATEHPNTWVVEVLHDFYAHPDLAERVWVNLRYCKTFRQELADLKLRKEAQKVKRARWARWAHWLFPLRWGHLEPVDGHTPWVEPAQPIESLM
jgi:hypothetical protein